MQHADTDNRVKRLSFRQPLACFDVSNKHLGRIANTFLTDTSGVRAQLQRFKLTAGRNEALSELTCSGADLKTTNPGLKPGGIDQETGATVCPLLPSRA